MNKDSFSLQMLQFNWTETHDGLKAFCSNQQQSNHVVKHISVISNQWHRPDAALVFIIQDPLVI